MAKILIMSEYGAGLWFSLRLLEEGNSVHAFVYQKSNRATLRNIIPDILDEKPSDFSRYDLVIFDQTGRPRDAETARKQTATIGDGELATELEDNREFGIEVMENVGIAVPPYEVFDAPEEAKKFIRKTKKRYVYKPFEPPSGEQGKDVTYVSSSPDDMLRYIDRLYAMAKGTPFMLQEFVSGTECSVEGWFNGESFSLLNATLEEKKFMDGGKGPNTGCSGNLLFTFHNEPRLYTEGLEKMREFLAGSKFRGMIDLNTIITEDKAYGLEWTPRFGYDASATLFNSLHSSLTDLFGDIASGGVPDVEITNQFSAGVRLTIPPYPTELTGRYHPAEVPIDGVEEDECIKDVYLYDCMVSDSGELCTAGITGIVCVPMASADTIGEAFAKVYHKIEQIKIPNMQFRTDIEKATLKRYHTLSSQGWI